MPSGGSFAAIGRSFERDAHVVDPDRQRGLAAVLAVAERLEVVAADPDGGDACCRRSRRTTRRGGRWSSRSCRRRPRGRAPSPPCRCRAARRRASSTRAGRRRARRSRAARASCRRRASAGFGRLPSALRRAAPARGRRCRGRSRRRRSTPTALPAGALPQPRQARGGFSLKITLPLRSFTSSMNYGVDAGSRRWRTPRSRARPTSGVQRGGAQRHRQVRRQLRRS